MKSRLPQIEKQLAPAVNKALGEAAERIAAQAKANAPVRTGALKNSIEAKPGVFRVRERPAQGYGIYAAWYWFFQEFGTVNQAAQPFMVPAAEAERLKLLADVKRALGNL